MKSGTFNKSTVTTAPTFVQVAAKNAGTVASTTQAFGAASTTGNTIVVTIEYDHATATISSVTDTKGNTYTLAAGPTNWGVPLTHTATYVAKNITGGGAAITITVTLSAAPATGFEVFQTEYSGLDATNPVDQVSTAFGNNTASPANSGSKTTTEDNELIYGFAGSTTGGMTGGATYLPARSTFDTQFQGDKLAAAAGSYSVDATFAGTKYWAAHMVTLKGVRHQSVTFGGEFQPSAVLFASAQDITRANPVAHARVGVGAVDGTTQGSTADADF
ncbi:MAG TPA: hypothetical protein VKJ07_04635, partial [Mycobacteriales bacterium]|nr:hypothetical protein [Mycobacteriales bacterium]